ncbi:MAG: hypothetical protein AAB195_06430 [candidate division NC10 bacterium]|mgnify:CR=1 FL=1
MRPRDPVCRVASGTGRGWGRVTAQLLLLVILALAPALDLAGDGRAAGMPDGPASTLDLCTLSGLTPPPPVLAPVMPMARVPETAATRSLCPLARPVDHPPRPA